MACSHCVTRSVVINPTVGGNLRISQKASDGNGDYSFEIIFTELIKDKQISYKIVNCYLDCKVKFQEIEPNKTKVILKINNCPIEKIEADKLGWESILNDFKNYVNYKYAIGSKLITKDITINSPAEHVWQVLTNPKYIDKWIGCFNSDFTQYGQIGYRNIIHMLDKNQDGVFWIVDVHIPNFMLSFIDLGTVTEGEEKNYFKKTDYKKGRRTTYTLTEFDGVTKLNVYNQTTTEEYTKLVSFLNKWTTVIKEMSENICTDKK